MIEKVQVWLALKEGTKLKALLLQTNRKRGEFWQPVTGHVESGEEIAAAAKREVQEETGLQFDTAPLPLGHDFNYDKEGVQFHETVFYYELREKPIELRIDPREHQSYCWLVFKEVEECLKFESNQSAFNKLSEKLKKASGKSKK